MSEQRSHRATSQTNKTQTRDVWSHSSRLHQGAAEQGRFGNHHSQFQLEEQEEPHFRNGRVHAKQLRVCQMRHAQRSDSNQSLSVRGSCFGVLVGVCGAHETKEKQIQSALRDYLRSGVRDVLCCACQCCEVL